MTLIVDNVEITKVNFNGVALDEVFFDGVLVWPDYALKAALLSEAPASFQTGYVAAGTQNGPYGSLTPDQIRTPNGSYQLVESAVALVVGQSSLKWPSIRIRDYTQTGYNLLVAWNSGANEELLGQDGAGFRGGSQLTGSPLWSFINNTSTVNREATFTFVPV